MTVDELKQHLLSRGFDSDKYHCWLSPYGWLTVPLYDFSGMLRGYQTYNPSAAKGHGKCPSEAKYFTHSSTQCLWGLETLTGNEGLVLVAESVFKAVALHNAGYAALAMLGSSPSKALLKQLKLQPFKVVAVGDNDSAGEKFARKLNGFVSPVDVDEMSTENLKNFLAKKLNF
ncbi:DNA primase [Salmonella phage S147]|uniref:DNA primase n=6 Tax=Epseptimavirus TaxID=2732017 RepID=A0A6G8RF73_9CAUD|nr:DNA primase [Salmonella phage S126]YP_009805977.1 DNA primase [Salmonella phage S147]YP_009858319.1 DNA primase [Salmonella phage rokbiter]EDV1300602.1 hypothetical protein [Salmonella enterica subsp. enterica serovar Hadar]QIN99883.1 hypothetical protein misterkot_103 [Salmonella phage misterkot]QIO00044.1 hypothetical protein ende_104 [Salmonella phage ende]WFG41288.1 DNA primase [Salmonella phage MET_P1_137_112]AXC41403.1 hypothetical protein [Salmonella phage S126]